MDETRVDSELKSKMEDLGIMEVEDSNAGADADTEDNEACTKTGSRVLRKRKSLAPDSSKSVNRRVSMKPRKHTSTIDSPNSKQIEALYLNKKVKNLTQTLETIYEEPKTGNAHGDTLIGGRKVKRLLTFQYQYTKEKIKKRRAKIKKLLGNKTFLNRKKIPMKVFLETIQSLELDDMVQTGISPPIVDKVK